MNLFAKYLANFIRRASGPRCEDCAYYRPENSCTMIWLGFDAMTFPADKCRRKWILCGKRGHFFEPKESE